jgi:hypothetical protein
MKRDPNEVTSDGGERVCFAFLAPWHPDAEFLL